MGKHVVGVLRNSKNKVIGLAIVDKSLKIKYESFSSIMEDLHKEYCRDAFCNAKLVGDAVALAGGAKQYPSIYFESGKSLNGNWRTAIGRYFDLTVCCDVHGALSLVTTEEIESGTVRLSNSCEDEGKIIPLNNVEILGYQEEFTFTSALLADRLKGSKYEGKMRVVDAQKELTLWPGIKVDKQEKRAGEVGS